MSERARPGRTCIGMAAGCGLATVLAVIAIAVVWWVVGFRNPFYGARFDRAIWISNDHNWDMDNPRGKMAGDIRTHYLRRGMTRSQVVKPLGKPDFHGSADHFVYHLGSWSGFRMDCDSLDVYFDSSGRLTRTRIVQH